MVLELCFVYLIGNKCRNVEAKVLVVRTVDKVKKSKAGLRNEESTCVNI